MRWKVSWRIVKMSVFFIKNWLYFVPKTVFFQQAMPPKYINNVKNGVSDVSAIKICSKLLFHAIWKAVFKENHFFSKSNPNTKSLFFEMPRLVFKQRMPVIRLLPLLRFCCPSFVLFSLTNEHLQRSFFTNVSLYFDHVYKIKFVGGI